MQWSNINFNQGIIYVQRPLQRLLEQHERGKIKLLFTSNFVSSLINHHAEPRTVIYRFKKYLRQARIEAIHFHVLRHTFATRCVELGVGLSKLMGHHSINLPLDTYTASL